MGSMVERIRRLAQEEPSSTNKILVEKELDVLGALCHHIYPDLKEGERHPVVLLLNQLFPAVQLLTSKWCVDHAVIEVRRGGREGGRGREGVGGREWEGERVLMHYLWRRERNGS